MRCQAFGKDAAHTRFFHDYKVQPHFAHLGRADGERNRQAVLGWVPGIWCEPAELDRLFTLRVERCFDRRRREANASCTIRGVWQFP